MPKALTPSPQTFAQGLVHWKRQHGRHDLPWKRTREPYRVRLSEVMVQRNQVRTGPAPYTQWTLQQKKEEETPVPVRTLIESYD